MFKVPNKSNGSVGFFRILVVAKLESVPDETDAFLQSLYAFRNSKADQNGGLIHQVAEHGHQM